MSKTFEQTKYYAIHKNTELFGKVNAVFSKVNEVNSIADKLAIELGGTGSCKNQYKLAGGISAIEFEGGKPSDDWKQVGDKYQNLFYPKAKSKQLNAKLDELPTMDYNEMTDVIGFEQPQSFCTNNGFSWVHCPHIFLTDDDNFIMLEIQKGMRYDVPDGVIEINQEQFKSAKPKSYR